MANQLVGLYMILGFEMILQVEGHCFLTSPKS